MTPHPGMPALAAFHPSTIRSRGRSTPQAPGAPAVNPAATVAALVDLGRELQRQAYTWICPSAETQAMVNGRFANRRAHNLTDLFGWNREGSLETLASQLPAHLIDTLCEAGVLQITDGDAVRSRVRFSSFADTLLAHSAWPAQESDAVLVGPETQRFGAFITREMHGPLAPQASATRPFTLVDLGCGSGAAGILASRLLGAMDGAAPTRVLLTDRHPRALRFAEVNAKLAQLPHFDCRHSDVLAAVSEPPLLVLANAPGLMDPQRRAQLHGGGELGTGLALRIVDECLNRLLPGGSLLMCAVAPVVRGADLLRQCLEPRLARAGTTRRAQLRYEVLEADVLSPQLAHPAFADVDRLALVGITVHVQASGVAGSQSLAV